MQKQIFENAVLYLGDCVDILPSIIIDYRIAALIADPPYMIGASGAGMGNGRKYLQDIKGHLDCGFDLSLLTGFDNWLVFCAKAQLVELIGQAKSQGLNWMLLTWNKRNPTPLVNNTYLPDTEYMVHAFKKHIWEHKTRFVVGNVEKNPFNHPTVKPLYVMNKAVMSASAKGDWILDHLWGLVAQG